MIPKVRGKIFFFFSRYKRVELDSELAFRQSSPLEEMLNITNVLFFFKYMYFLLLTSKTFSSGAEVTFEHEGPGLGHLSFKPSVFP